MKGFLFLFPLFFIVLFKKVVILIDVMISKHTYKDITWIDVQNPDREEILHLAETYPIPPVVGEELLSRTVRSKVDFYDKVGVIYLVLHFPAIAAKTGECLDQEIDFILGKNFIITTHYENIDALHDFVKLFEVKSVLDKGFYGDHAGHLFILLLRELYHYSEDQLTIINGQIYDLESTIYTSEGVSNVEQISLINRRLLNFQQALRFHSGVLKSFEVVCPKIYGEEFVYQLPVITSEYMKVENVLSGHKDILNDLRETNDSLLTTKTNEVIKFLTIMTFAMFPITLISTILSINDLPVLLGIDSVGDFLVVFGSLVFFSSLMTVYFRYKRWF